MRTDLFRSSPSPLRRLVLAVTEPDEAAALFAAASEGAEEPWAMIAVSGVDWNRELSPWPAPPAFRRGEAFGGKAETLLKTLTEETLPQARAALGAEDAPCVIAGYSLAGLFALWALLRGAGFAGAVSASGSLWFPGFREWAIRQPLTGRPAVYLSLGDREAASRNPVTGSVAEETKRLAAHFTVLGLPSVFAWNPGDHFAEPTARLARGIRWALAHTAS